MELADLRRHHLSLVVETMLDGAVTTRAELAQRIGLTKATVSAVVAELIDRDVVVEGQTLRDGRMGRPGIGIELRAMSIGALGLEISVDDVAACVVDLAGTVRSRRRLPVDNRDAHPEIVVARLRRVAADVLASPEASGVRCVGGALAVPGLVDPSTRSLVVAPNLHWHDVVLPSSGPELAIELTVDNEANLAALGELRHGAARGLTSFVHVSAGVGIGGGLVLDGRVVRGANGFAGEIGHVVVDPDGPLCACGTRGCLETVVAAATSPLAVAHAVAAALRSVVHLVDPEAVVLGGSLAALPDTALAEIGARLRTDTLGGRWHSCDVRRSHLAADAALIGAATTALDAFVADPTLAPAHPSTRTA